MAVETRDAPLVTGADAPASALADPARGRLRGRRRGWLVRRTLVLADIIGLCAAFAVAAAVFSDRVGPTDAVGHMSEVFLFLATIPGWIVLAGINGLYARDEERAGHGTIDDVFPIFQLVTVGSFLFFAGSWLTGFADPYPPKLLTFWILGIAFVVAGRVVARMFCRRHLAYVQNTVIVGADAVGQLLARKLLDHPEYGINIVGFVDPEVGRDTSRAADLPVLGTPAALPSLVESLDVERVMVASDDATLEDTGEVIRSAKALNLQIDVVPRLFGTVDPSAGIYTVEGLPLITMPPVRAARSTQTAKRAFDIVAAAAGLLFLMPVFAFIALKIRLDSPGPVFYRHRRVGLNGRSFSLVKFRTMYVESSLEETLADPAAREEFERTHKLTDDPRVTRFGRFLRKTSMDELPQLWNILVGDMSLVGPRPVTEDELARYGGAVPTLLSFRPGVTGYWQINGRSRTLYDERVRLDIAYIQGWSLKLDLIIIGKTFWVLVKQHGAY